MKYIKSSEDYQKDNSEYIPEEAHFVIIDSCYIIRIELHDLKKSNNKAEYETMYKQLTDAGFRSFCKHDNESFELPEGVYSLSMHSAANTNVAANLASETVRKSLLEHGYQTLNSHYSVLVSQTVDPIGINLKKCKEDEQTK